MPTYATPPASAWREDYRKSPYAAVRMAGLKRERAKYMPDMDSDGGNADIIMNGFNNPQERGPDYYRALQESVQPLVDKVPGMVNGPDDGVGYQGWNKPQKAAVIPLKLEGEDIPGMKPGTIRWLDDNGQWQEKQTPNRRMMQQQQQTDEFKKLLDDIPFAQRAQMLKQEQAKKLRALGFTPPADNTERNQKLQQLAIEKYMEHTLNGADPVQVARAINRQLKAQGAVEIPDLATYAISKPKSYKDQYIEAALSNFKKGNQNIPGMQTDGDFAGTIGPRKSLADAPYTMTADGSQQPTGWRPPLTLPQQGQAIPGMVPAGGWNEMARDPILREALGLPDPEQQALQREELTRKRRREDMQDELAQLQISVAKRQALGELSPAERRQVEQQDFANALKWAENYRKNGLSADDSANKALAIVNSQRKARGMAPMTPDQLNAGMLSPLDTSLIALDEEASRVAGMNAKDLAKAAYREVFNADPAWFKGGHLLQLGDESENLLANPELAQSYLTLNRSKILQALQRMGVSQERAPRYMQFLAK